MGEACLEQRLGTREFRHHSPLGEWHLICREPDPRLRGYVREYVGYVEGAASVLRRLEVPGLDIPIIINFGAPFRLVASIDERAPARSPEYRTFVAGLWESCALVESAGRSHIFSMVTGRCFVLALAGIVPGVAIAYAAGRGMQALLAGVAPADATTFGAAVGLSVIMTIAGGLVPTLRALRVNPMTAMRTE